MKRKQAPNPDLRPIGARALKSARDTLRPYLEGARCLDLYAGTGRFGHSAIEEGAQSVVFVDRNGLQGPPRSRAPRQGSRSVSMDVFAYLAKTEERFDIIFADPPFRLFSETFLDELTRRVARVADNEAIFLVKRPSRVVASINFPGWLKWKEARFGESCLVYWKRTAQDTSL